MGGRSGPSIGGIFAAAADEDVEDNDEQAALLFLLEGNPNPGDGNGDLKAKEERTGAVQ